MKKYDICINGACTRWDEGLPLGNSKMGCLVYGDSPLFFALDRQDLWDTRPNPTTQEKGFCFDNLKRLVNSGKEEDWAEYTRLFDDVFTATAYPSKITAGRVQINFGADKVRSSHLSLSTATAQVQGEKGTLAEVFASATRFIGVAKVYGAYTLDIHIPDYISGGLENEPVNNSGIGNKDADACMRYPRANVVTDGDFMYYDQTTHTPYRYGVVVYRVKKSGYDELYFTVATNKDFGKTEYNEKYIENAKKELLSAASVGYTALLTEHTAWWKRYWGQSKISLSDELIERTYYRSWYLFASTSREGFLPMPLQGVWTADNDSLPPWKGDYHFDTNVQLSYAAFCKANRLPEGKVLLDYMWTMRERYTQFAKEFFGVDGLLIPSCSTLDGKPMGGWAQYSLSPTMTIWAAQSFDEYYVYTGDTEFLKTRAYPFFQQVERAIYALLEEKDGKLYLPLSSSPEIHGNAREAYLVPNSNFDLALLRYLYTTLIGYAKVLGYDGAKYQAALDKLDDIAIQNGKIIMLDCKEILNESHRHFSHLMCLYPLHLINYDTPEHKRLYECTIYELERLGMGFWVGFSYAMCAQIYAMAEKGNSAYEKLYQFARGFVADNGFHLNGDFKEYGYTTFHYRPFTLESLFGWCDALHEMLLQDHQGYVHLFPAIPAEWKQRNISFEKLRSVNGILISAKCQKGALKEVTLQAPRPLSICLKNTFGVGQVCVDGQIVEEKDGYFTLSLKKGKTKITV